MSKKNTNKKIDEMVITANIKHVCICGPNGFHADCLVEAHGVLGMRSGFHGVEVGESLS